MDKNMALLILLLNFQIDRKQIQRLRLAMPAICTAYLQWNAQQKSSLYVFRVFSRLVRNIWNYIWNSKFLASTVTPYNKRSWGDNESSTVELAEWRNTRRTAFPGRRNSDDGLERPSYFIRLKYYRKEYFPSAGRLSCKSSVDAKWNRPEDGGNVK